VARASERPLGQELGTHLATERAGLVTFLLQVRAPVLHPTVLESHEHAAVVGADTDPEEEHETTGAHPTRAPLFVPKPFEIVPRLFSNRLLSGCVTYSPFVVLLP
jgi:hypothetical protein